MQVDDVLKHAGVYDPVARRERYLKNRQLKGRQPGHTPPPAGKRPNLGSSPGPSLHAKAAQGASQARQIAAFRGRLENLRSELKKLMAEAGTSSKSTSTSSKSGGTKGAKGKPMTAKEKADARKASEKYRKEHPELNKKKGAASKTMTKTEKIAHLRAVIKDVESQLKAALDRARTQTASNGR